MGARQSRPQRGSEVAHWPYCATEPGSVFKAWFAGGAFWTRTHGEKPSTPCLEEITAGALACAKCAALVPTVLIGYVPIYREEDNKPCLVIVHEDQWDAILGLPKWQPILVGRGSGRGDGVWVRRWETLARYQTTLESRQRIPNLLPSLLRMWKLPALTQWVEADRAAHGLDGGERVTKQPADSDSGLSLLTPEKGGEDRGPGATDSSAESKGAAPGLPLADDAYEVTKNRINKKLRGGNASANGNGKH